MFYPIGKWGWGQFLRVPSDLPYFNQSPPILPTLEMFVTVFGLDSQLTQHLSLSNFRSSLVQRWRKKIHLVPYERILSIPIPFGDEEIDESTEPGWNNVLDSFPFSINLFLFIICYLSISLIRYFNCTGLKKAQALSETFPYKFKYSNRKVRCAPFYSLYALWEFRWQGNSTFKSISWEK